MIYLLYNMNKIKLTLITFLSALLFIGCEKEKFDVSLTFSEASYEMEAGDTLNLFSVLEIFNAEGTPEFTSSDTVVATVSKDGVLKALKAGETTVEASLMGVKASCTVVITALQAEKIILTPSDTTITKGKAVSVVAKVEPKGYNYNNLNWTFLPQPASVEGHFKTEKVSSNEYKVSFTDFVTGGSVIVRVSDNNSSVVANAYVRLSEEKLQGLTELSLPKYISARYGDEPKKIEATYAPEDFAGTLTWTSSNKEIATVDNGTVTFKGEGSAVITAKDEISGLTADCVVVVGDGVTEISVSPRPLDVLVGSEPMTLVVSTVPANYPLSILEWSSTYTNVSTVNNGVVTFVAAGKAEIHVTDPVSKKKAVCEVNVADGNTDAVIKTITLDQVNLNISVGDDPVQIKATCKDENGAVVENYANLAWTAVRDTDSEGTEYDVIEVSDIGVVTPKAEGKTVITVSDKKNGAVKATCNVNVSAKKVTVNDVRLEPTERTLEKGKSFTIEASVLPMDAEDKTLNWSSSDENVATVTQDGEVTAVGYGKALIIATSVNGIKGNCTVKVPEYDESITPTGITFESETRTIRKSKTVAIAYTLSPEGCGYRDIVWSSSDATVASVDQGGLVTGLKEGKTTIKAKLKDYDFQATCEVEVQEIFFNITFPDLTNPAIGKDGTGIPQFETVQLKPTYTPVFTDVDGTEYIPLVTSWKSSDETLAKVDENGKVTAVYDGNDITDEGYKLVKITHVADGEEKSVDIKITRALPKSIEITASPENNQMYVGDSFTFTSKVYPEQANQDFMWSYYFEGEHMMGDIGPYTGTFTPKKEGVFVVEVQASARSSVRSSVEIKVLPVLITNAYISDSTLELYPGDKTSISVTIEPWNATYKQIQWASTDETVVKVTQAAEMSKGDIEAVGTGTAEVTATLTNGEVLTCEVTVKEDVVSTVAVGDYYYSNGTTSSELRSGETPVGVVFSLENVSSQDDKMKKKMGNKITGLVMALHNSEKTSWDSTPTAKVSDWAVRNGYASLTGIDISQKLIEEGTYFRGYNNTMAIKAYMESSEYATSGNTINLLNNFPETVLPSNTSGWYVPSYAELYSVYENQNTINNKLLAAGGDAIILHNPVGDNDTDAKVAYWTSTEGYNVADALAIWFNNEAVPTVVMPERKERTNYNDWNTGNSYCIRYIFAF